MSKQPTSNQPPEGQQTNAAAPSRVPPMVAMFIGLSISSLIVFGLVGLVVWLIW